MVKFIMTKDQNFSDWFQAVTGNAPYPYQVRLANAIELPIVIDVPTGLGKTALIVLAWLWRRKYSDDLRLRKRTPRRLVYILPMRTLVDQSVNVIQEWLEKLVELNQESAATRIRVHQLMGGAIDNDWDRSPDRDCIIVGTQDQILSRCLNRGYGMSKYKWPIHFGLLNQDCLFVVDETQLMGAGFRTTSQLQGLRETWGTYGNAKTVWMSATLDAEMLTTADYKPDFEKEGASFTLDDDDKAHLQVRQRLDAKKQLRQFAIACPAKEKEEATYLDALTKQIATAAENARKADGSPGLVLVICNRVRRAQALYSALRSKTQNLLLIHSRFRAGDRAGLNKKLLDNQYLSGIVVATQAIEAGVDLSAQVLFTELSPWSSFVQRVGRCNRKGTDNGSAIVYWMDFNELSEESARPYEVEELEKTREFLGRLTDVGPASLRSFWDGLDIEERPVQRVEGLIPRKHDLMQLFDTSTDLAGHDVDISPFIRDAKNADVAIAWRDWMGDAPPDDAPVLQRNELCQVGIGSAKEFLRIKTVKGYTFDRLQKSWILVKPDEIYPGVMILVHCKSGGYDGAIGFTGNVKHEPNSCFDESIAQEADNDDSDLLSGGAKNKGVKEFVSLKQHSEDIVTALKDFLKSLNGSGENFDQLPVAELERSARWHDAGKAHPEFQAMLTNGNDAKQKEDLWAKSDGQKTGYRYPADRRGFRHELVSALLALQRDEAFLVAYLAACHHGKVRMTIQPRPTEQAPSDRATDQSDSEDNKPNRQPELKAGVAGPQRFALGVHEGDAIPEIDLGGGLEIGATRVSLACMELGGTLKVQMMDGIVELKADRSWTDRSVELLEHYGPFQLAFLEALIRVADWEASAKVGINLEASDAG